MLSEITRALFDEKSYPETVDLLTEAFCQNDPIEAALQITRGEFRVMIELELGAVVHNGLSLVARETRSGRLVGALIASDALAENIDSCGKASQKFEPISEIAQIFHAFYLKNRSIQPGSCLYLFAIGVQPDLAGKGVGKMLIGQTLAHAKSQGYRSAFALTTSLASTHAFEQHQFRIIKTLPYQTYRYQNRPVFSSITEHPGINLMERGSLDDVEVGF